MPVVGFIDPQTGEAVATADYLEAARSGELFLRGVPFHYAALKTMAFERDVREVSATELLGCARRKFLTAETPYYIHPASHWRRYRGTSIHTAIEAQTGEAVNECQRCDGWGRVGNDPGEPCDECGGVGYFGPVLIAEQRFRRTVELDGNEVAVSGQVDMYWPDLGVIADHKDKVYASKKDPPQASHVWQMSIYAWIIAGDPTNTYPVPTKGGIYYQDGKNPVLKRFDLYPLDQVEAFVVGRLREFVGYGNGVYPDPVRDEDEVKFFCTYCPVRATCERLATEGR